MIKNILPLLTLRDVIIFPGTIVPIFIGREKSLNALLEAKKIDGGKYILLTTQNKQNLEDPNQKDLYKVGMLAKIFQTVTLPNNNAKILVEAQDRVKLKITQNKKFFSAEYSILPDKKVTNLPKLDASIKDLIEEFKDYSKIDKKISLDIINLLNAQKDHSYITHIISSHLNCKLELKQDILQETDVQKRIDQLFGIIKTEITYINTDKLIQQRVKKQIDKTQKDFYLNEQMKALQKEMNNGDEKSDFAEMEKKIKKLKLSKDAKDKANSELRKFKMMNPMSAESYVVRNYLETLLGMPWGKSTKHRIDIKKSEEILDNDHYGLKKVKERIIEHLSVLKRSNNKLKSPILCLIGPPGVGKTSLVKSIAKAMGRKYIKFALGGVRDESEVRGHRRTYLGSMPGKPITLLKKVQVDNPVMLLDEIDKISSDFRGSPASALLELLDPEQNKRFSDHYLEVEYDLSNVAFIATANSYNLPHALMDRMEIINISGYVEEEKLKIARDHLIPKQFKMHNIRPNELLISDKAILDLIRYYTKESGVRSLEREICTLVRKTLTRILKEQDLKKVIIEPQNLEEYLSVKKYHFGVASKENQIGITTGLAYSEVGGDILNVEAVKFPGKGTIKSTGKLGDVMKESVEAAYSCFLSRTKELGIKEEEYKDIDIHLHVPEGATPKDGPSAGVAIYTTLISLMTNTPVNKNVAMTGEITLRGSVLPIGGLKEKLLGAKRGGIKKVVIPEQNAKDLKDIPETITNNLEIIHVSNIEQVLEHALIK